MNKTRRKQLEEISDKANELRFELENIKDDEQEYFDNIPESLQGGDKGTLAEEAISNLEEAITALESAIDYIDTAKE